MEDVTRRQRIDGDDLWRAKPFDRAGLTVKPEAAVRAGRHGEETIKSRCQRSQRRRSRMLAAHLQCGQFGKDDVACKQSQFLDDRDRTYIGVEHGGDGGGSGRLEDCGRALRPPYVDEDRIGVGDEVQRQPARIASECRIVVRHDHPFSRRIDYHRANRRTHARAAPHMGAIDAGFGKVGNDPPADTVVAHAREQRTSAAQPRNCGGGACGHAVGDLDGVDRQELARPGRQSFEPED
jgi:hypothetical protein